MSQILTRLLIALLIYNLKQVGKQTSGGLQQNKT